MWYGTPLLTAVLSLLLMPAVIVTVVPLGAESVLRSGESTSPLSFHCYC